MRTRVRRGGQNPNSEQIATKNIIYDGSVKDLLKNASNNFRNLGDLFSMPNTKGDDNETQGMPNTENKEGNNKETPGTANTKGDNNTTPGTANTEGKNNTTLEPKTNVEDSKITVGTGESVSTTVTENQKDTLDKNLSPNVAPGDVGIMIKIVYKFRKIMEDLNTLPSKYVTLGLMIPIVLMVGFLLTIINLAYTMYKHKKASRILQTNRYNKDLPEYKIARSVLLQKYLLFLLIPSVALFLLLGMIALIDYDLAYNPSVFIIRPIGYYITAFLVSAMILVFAVVFYMKTKKTLQPIQKRISIFEEYVYKRFYIRKDIMRYSIKERNRCNRMYQVLYNGGKIPTVNAILKKAARIAIQAPPQGKKLDLQMIQQVAYTLCMYKYLQKDLVNEEDQKRTYRKDVLHQFSPMNLLMPRKPFGIADYMLADNAADMVNTYDIASILRIIQGIVPMNQATQQNLHLRVQADLMNTRSMASKIHASRAWKQVYQLLLASTLPYILVYLPVVILLAVSMMWK